MIIMTEKEKLEAIVAKMLKRWHQSNYDWREHLDDRNIRYCILNNLFIKE